VELGAEDWARLVGNLAGGAGGRGAVARAITWSIRREGRPAKLADALKAILASLGPQRRTEVMGAVHEMLQALGQRAPEALLRLVSAGSVSDGSTTQGTWTNMDAP
jgi:hypothetical protein